MPFYTQSRYMKECHSRHIRRCSSLHGRTEPSYFCPIKYRFRTAKNKNAVPKRVWILLPYTGSLPAWCIWSILYLTHLPLVPHTRFSESDQHWSRQWLVTIIHHHSAPSHYLNQCWVVVKWTVRNKLQWNINQTKLFIDKNAVESVVWEMAAILSRRRWVNSA